MPYDLSALNGLFLFVKLFSKENRLFYRATWKGLVQAMKSNINITKKTYYAMGVLGAALNVIGSLLAILGIYAGFLFNVATLLGGAMMLLLGAHEGVANLKGKLSFVALALMLFSMMKGYLGLIGGALAWPCFAIADFTQTKEGDILHTAAFLVFICGAVQLVASFLTLPMRLKSCMAVAISISQLLFAYRLFCAEKEKQA